MLLETDSRILTIAMETLMEDFEPCDAIPFMCSRQIFTEDQQDTILSMPVRTLRVVEFIRQYRKTANELGPLVDYFEQYGQKHLANILSKQYVPEERPILTNATLENRLFMEGNVPRMPFYREERRDLLENLQKLLTELSFRDQFWLVIHGFPGCGKTLLAADVLCTYPVLLSRYYEHVIWVEDGCTDAGQLPELFSNFVFLATDALALTGKETPLQFSALAKTALREKPNTLVVLNDVYIRESVRWFDHLNCRILATSRNLDIFQVSSRDPIYFAVQPIGFSLIETGNLLCETKSYKSCPSYMEQLHHIHQKTAGLPALIGILRQKSCDIASFNGLFNLRNSLDCYAVASISHFTYYKYKNMIDSIMVSYKSLTKWQKLVMETFVFFDSDEWIPLDLISLCIPMDIAGRQDILYTTLQQLEPLAKLSLIDKRIIDSCSIAGDKPFYDFHINPIMHSFLCVTVDRCALEERLHQFIRPQMLAVLNEQQSLDSVFLERIRSYTNLHPSLFQHIPYENCFDRLENFERLNYDKKHNSLKNCNVKSCEQFIDGEIFKKSSDQTVRSWADSCIFM